MNPPLPVMRVTFSLDKEQYMTVTEYPPRLPHCGTETLGETCATRDVAEVLGTSMRSAQSLCRKGEITAVKKNGKWRMETASLLAFQEGIE